MKYLGLIVRNLRRRLRRTILVVLTIAIATMVFAILVAVPDSMDRIIDSAAAGQRLYIVNRAGPAPTYGVPGKYCHDIRSMPHVAACAAEWDFYMTYRSPSDWISMTPSDLEILDLAPDYHGSPEEYAHYRREKRAAALGTEVMRKYGWRVGQTIMLHSPDGLDFAFVIVSVLPSQYYPNAFLVRRDYLEDTYKSRGGIGDASRLVVRVDTADNLGGVARAVDEKYRNSEAETRSETESELLAGAFARIGSIRAIIFSLVAVVIVTVLLIAGNAMAMTVRERIPEVALLRTLGFPRTRIGYLLLGEAIILGFIGGLTGSLAALVLFARGADMGALTSGLGLISVTPVIAALSLSVAIAVSVLAGTLPIVGALEIPPAVALRKPG